jgi:hypothetical protein
MSWDGTSPHHERGLHIWGVKKAWDHVAPRLGPYQTVVTAVVAHRDRRDGIAVGVQQPKRYAEEMASWQETVPARDAQMEAARGRLWALCHPCMHRLGYEKRTESALEIGQPLDQAGHFPPVH